MFDILPILGLMTAYGTSLLIGYLFVDEFLKKSRFKWLKVFLSPGIGFGFTALALFLSVLIAGELSKTSAIIIHAAALAILVVIKLKRPLFNGGVTLGGKRSLFAILLVTLLLVLPHILKSPYGTGLDVWAIWKLKARFLYYGGQDWNNLFSPTLGFSHPDYPLLYPFLITWGWLGAGSETPVASILIACIYTLSIVGLIIGVFLYQRRSEMAWLAAFFCISVPVFTGMGASQYADIIVAYYILSGMILLVTGNKEIEEKFVFLAGVVLGLNCFVKDEGWLFWVVTTLSMYLANFFQRNSRRRFMTAFVLGSLPPLLVAFLLKGLASYSNDFVSVANIRDLVQSGQWLDRAWVIVAYFIEAVLQENQWSYAFFFFMACFLLFPRLFVKENYLFITLTLLFLNAGYFCIYMISPLGLKEHLEFSLDRLLIHGFPLAVYLSFGVLSERGDFLLPVDRLHREVG